MGARGLSLAAAAAVLSFGLLPATAGAAGLPDREADPVVLTGADVPGLIGIAPASVVAFAHGGGWEQIPVQVDERAVVDYRAVRQTTGFGPFTHEAYTDPGTFAGADPDPTLDAGDEIAMMAKDAGGNASAVSSPPGVVDATRTAVMVSDPLNPGPDRFIYLFRTNSGLDPAAGKSYVDYDFSLNSGDYETTYDWDGVANDGLGPRRTPRTPSSRLRSTRSTCSRDGWRTSSPSRPARRRTPTSSTATRLKSHSAAAAAS